LDDSSSPYYQKLDTAKVGAMGHSQGSSGTANLASDPRVKAVILWNGGASASKPFFAISGDGDIGAPTPSSMRSALQAASVEGAFLFFHMVLQMGDLPGHLTLVTEPARVVEPAVAWWKYILNGDAVSKEYFIGSDCTLCNRMAEFVVVIALVVGCDDDKWAANGPAHTYAAQRRETSPSMTHATRTTTALPTTLNQRKPRSDAKNSATTNA
jgi:pimeloyl-ACP methyl ester carboxylesterase